jgi:hypothetical protein
LRRGQGHHLVGAQGGDAGAADGGGRRGRQSARPQWFLPPQRLKRQTNKAAHRAPKRQNVRSCRKCRNSRGSPCREIWRRLVYS